MISSNNISSIGYIISVALNRIQMENAIISVALEV